MIYCLVGRPGTGKTYSLVAIAYKALISGRDVYSNFFIDLCPLIDKRKRQIDRLIRFFSFCKLYFVVDYLEKKQIFGVIRFWKNLSDFTNLREGLILMDEAQIYINSREYKYLPPEVQYKFQQHRKQGLDLYLAVQNVKRIDVVARELVNSVFEFRKIWRVFIMREYDIEEIDKVKRTAYRIKFSLFSKKIAQCYNTFQEIVR